MDSGSSPSFAAPELELLQERQRSEVLILASACRAVMQERGCMG